jgi:biotin carboxyl carrier protein
VSRLILDIDGHEVAVAALRRDRARGQVLRIDGFIWTADGPSPRLARNGEETHVEIGGEVFIVRVRSAAGASQGGGEADAALISPMSGEIISVAVIAGDVVEAGAELAVLESMKLHMSLSSPRRARVLEVLTAPRSMVGKGEVLVRLGDPEEEEAADAAD